MTESSRFLAAACAAPHALAAGAARDLLAEGANAAEAAGAAGAVLAVVAPDLNGLGGDGLFLLREPKGRMLTVRATGAVAAGLSAATLRGRGHEWAPASGADAALTAPGAAAGWAALLDYARAAGGRIPLARLLAPAISAAKTGVAIAEAERRALARLRPGLAEAPGFAAAFLVGGAAPEAGAARAQAALAGVLDHLAHAGLSDFHRGDVARELAADLARAGSPVTRADLSALAAQWGAPLETRIGRARLAAVGPPAGGFETLAVAGLAAGSDFGRDAPAALHRLIEAERIARALWRQAESPPGEAERALPLRERLEAALEPAALARAAAAIDGLRAGAADAPRRVGGAGLWFGAVDSDGLMVAGAQTLGALFGSGLVSPSTGVLMAATAAGAPLDGADALRPGQFPPLALGLCAADHGDGSATVFGVTGGAGQPTLAGHLAARLLAGMGSADAIAAPRLRPWADGDGAAVLIEDRVDPSLVAALERLGHRIVAGAPYDEATGQAGALTRDRRGHIEAARDPRVEAAAEGF
ncbi:MAG: gamma-glutamyltransferase [Rhizobiales bacterium]|nr:gamma-glutamyltransferase [Hyphomicrobiales bacterium]